MRKHDDDPRTEEQIREHYELEKQLAARLKNSTHEERLHLYSELYNELYTKLPHHPRNTRRYSAEDARRRAETQLEILKPVLKQDAVCMEIGAGDCSLACAAAPFVKKIYALEVSEAASKGYDMPDNVELVIFDGCNIPLPSDSVDIAYSMSVIEHLHPEDTMLQLESIARTLKPGGCYVLDTPHRYIGPRDISKYFDKVATGFHLKEYTYRELIGILRKAGFSRVEALMKLKGGYRRFPIVLPLMVELPLGILPYAARHRLACSKPFRRIMQIRLMSIK